MTLLFKPLKLAASIFAITTMIAGPASAQENQPQTPPPASNWVKICETDPTNAERKVCITTQELRGENGNFVASVGIRTFPDDEGAKPFIVVGLPLGLLLDPGIRYQVDQGERASLKYGICLPTGCFAETQVEEALINSLKKGNELIILAISGRGQTVPFRLSLLGFTRSYDGPPVDPAVLEQAQNELQERLRQRAEEQRKRLESEGGEEPKTE